MVEKATTATAAVCAATSGVVMMKVPEAPLEVALAAPALTAAKAGVAQEVLEDLEAKDGAAPKVLGVPEALEALAQIMARLVTRRSVVLEK